MIINDNFNVGIDADESNCLFDGLNMGFFNELFADIGLDYR